MAFKIEKIKRHVEDPATTSLKYHLHKHLCDKEPARPYGDVHASDLLNTPDFCPREHVLGMMAGKERRDRRVFTAEAVTFAYGYAVEDLVRNWYADIGRAWGDWACMACNRLHKFQRRPKKCKACGCKGLTYAEHKFLCPDSGIIARPDLFIDLGKPRLTMVEIKSMDKDRLKGLVAPLAEHRWRTNLYMRIIEESGDPISERIDVEKAYVLYVTKGGYGFKDEQVRRWKLSDGDFSPFKEFAVQRDDEDTEEQLEMARAVERYKRTGEVPLGICPTMFVKRAKYCTMCDECFSGVV